MLQCKRILAMLISTACIFGCCQIASADGVKEKQPYQVLESATEVTDENDLLAMAIRQHFQRGRPDKLLPDGETRESDQINVQQVLEKRQMPDGTVQQYCSSTTLKLMEETETGDLKEITMPEYIARAVASDTAYDSISGYGFTCGVTLYYKYEKLASAGYYTVCPTKVVSTIYRTASLSTATTLVHGYVYKDFFTVDKYSKSQTVNSLGTYGSYTVTNNEYTTMLRVDWGVGYKQVYGMANLYLLYNGQTKLLDPIATAGPVIS